MFFKLSLLVCFPEHVECRVTAHATACDLEKSLRFVKPRLHDTTCCQTGCQTDLTTGCIVYTNIQPVVKPVWQPAVSRIQPVVKVVKPAVQPGLTTG